MVLQKIFGWVLIFAGLFFVIAMPAISSGPGKYGGTGGYTPMEFQYTFVLIGVVLVGVGIFLLVKS